MCVVVVFVFVLALDLHNNEVEKRNEQVDLFCVPVLIGRVCHRLG